MRKNNTKKVILGIIAMLFVSVLAIPVSAFIVRLFISENINNPLFIFDLAETISIYDMLFLYFTIFSTGVMGLLTWAIFAFTQKKELDESNQKRMWIYSEILFLLNQIFQHRQKHLAAFIVRDDWMAHVCCCHELLSNEQYSKLLEFYGKCDKLMVATCEEEKSEKNRLAEEILNEILLPFYSIYKGSIGIDEGDIEDVSILLCSDYVDILNEIYPREKKLLFLNDHGKYTNGKKLYSFNKQNETYMVWGNRGAKLCEATIKNRQICTGFAMSGRYVGSFVEGKKDGYGMETYEYHGLNINPISKGTWKDGHLLNGEMLHFPSGIPGKKVKEVYPEDRSYQSEEIADYDVTDGMLGNEKNTRQQGA